MAFEARINEIEKIKHSHPQNIAIQCFDVSGFLKLSPDLQERLIACVRSGIENPDSAMGCYATHVSDYDDLGFFFRKVLAVHHHVSCDAQHVSDWTHSRNCDLAQLGLPAISTRVRVGRNLIGYPLPAAMTMQNRIMLEQSLRPVFEQLNTLPNLEGSYHSLTSGHPNEITSSEYQALVDAHLMFKNMADDPYLRSAGITADWPNGRGCYVSNSRQFVIWVGEEDHLRIMCMKTTTDLNEVIDGLKSILDQMAQCEGIRFAHSSQWGAITSCPTNLGTAMRASVHLQLPKLAALDSGKNLKVLTDKHGLAIRGAGGEHTAFGNDGTVDVSLRARFCITESRIIERLYEGIRVLVEQERSAR